MAEEYFHWDWAWNAFQVDARNCLGSWCVFVISRGRKTTLAETAHALLSILLFGVICWKKLMFASDDNLDF